MPLDDLVSVIETLQQRIRDYGDSLRQNEYRTRMALIDPLLTALGWDVADPSVVMPEYDVSGRKADYALLSAQGRPAATIEAKRLGESLESRRMQMLNYSNASGVEYSGLTDGNQWELYEVFKRGQLEDRRILDVTISREPSHRCALQFLLLWRPNLASGEPVAADEPLFKKETSTENVPPEATYDSYRPSAYGAPIPGSDDWITLDDFQPESATRPPLVRLPDGTEKQLRYWYQVLSETAEWLIRTGHLTSVKCPITNEGRVSIVHIEPFHASGRPFFHPYTLSNGLFLNKHGNRETLLKYVGFLLERLGQNRASIWLKSN